MLTHTQRLGVGEGQSCRLQGKCRQCPEGLGVCLPRNAADEGGRGNAPGGAKHLSRPCEGQSSRLPAEYRTDAGRPRILTFHGWGSNARSSRESGSYLISTGSGGRWMQAAAADDLTFSLVTASVVQAGSNAKCQFLSEAIDVAQKTQGLESCSIKSGRQIVTRPSRKFDSARAQPRSCRRASAHEVCVLHIFVAKRFDVGRASFRDSRVRTVRSTVLRRLRVVRGCGRTVDVYGRKACLWV